MSQLVLHLLPTENQRILCLLQGMPSPFHSQVGGMGEGNMLFLRLISVTVCIPCLRGRLFCGHRTGPWSTDSPFNKSWQEVQPQADILHGLVRNDVYNVKDGQQDAHLLRSSWFPPTPPRWSECKSPVSHKWTVPEWIASPLFSPLKSREKNRASLGRILVRINDLIHVGDLEIVPGPEQVFDKLEL